MEIKDSKETQRRVGENIEHIRLLKRKTIKEIANAIHLTDTGYRNIERGLTDISVTKLFQLAQILNVKGTQFLDLDIDLFINGEMHEKVNNIVGRKMEENYHLRIQQYKDENSFLRKQIDVLEKLLVNSENKQQEKRYPNGTDRF